MSRSITLALADDDETHGELVALWLEQLGYQVLRFASGDALLAWAEAASAPVDAVLLDVDMPGRDGYQSARDLRSLPAYARVPAAFVSAASPEGVPDEVVQAGPVQFIRKDGQMLVRLNEWLADTLVPLD